MRSFSGRVLVYGLGFSANRLISLIVLPVLAAYLSADAFGRIASLTVMALIFRTTFGIGVTAAIGIVYFESDSARHRARVMGSAVGFVAAMSVVMFVTAYGLSDMLAARYLGGQQAFLVWLQVLVVSLLLISDPLMLRLQFESEAVRYALVSVGAPVLGMAVTLILVAGYGMGVTGWAIGQLFIGLAQLGVSGFLAVSRGAIGRSSLVMIRQLVLLGMPFLPSFVFLYILQYSGHYFLAEKGNLSALGVYNVGYSLGMGMVLFVGAFNGAWYPYFQSHVDRRDDARRNFPQIANIYMAALAVLVFAAYVLAQPTMRVLTAPGLYEGYRVIGPVALGQAMLGFWGLLLPGVYFEKKVFFIPVLQGLAAPVAVVGTLALLGPFGPEGAAYAMAGGILSLVLLQIAFNVWRHYEMCAYEWRKIAAMGAVLLVQIALFRWLDGHLSMIESGAVGVVLALGGAYGIWRLLDAPDRALILQTLGDLRKGKKNVG